MQNSGDNLDELSAVFTTLKRWMTNRIRDNLILSDENRSFQMPCGCGVFGVTKNFHWKNPEIRFTSQGVGREGEEDKLIVLIW